MGIGVGGVEGATVGTEVATAVAVAVGITVGTATARRFGGIITRPRWRSRRRQARGRGRGNIISRRRCGRGVSTYPVSGSPQAAAPITINSVKRTEKHIGHHLATARAPITDTERASCRPFRPAATLAMSVSLPRRTSSGVPWSTVMAFIELATLQQSSMQMAASL